MSDKLVETYKFWHHLVEMIMETIRYYTNSGDIVTGVFTLMLFYDEITKDPLFDPHSFFHTKWHLFHGKSCRHHNLTRLSIVMGDIKKREKAQAQQES